MRVSRSIAAAALILFALTACHHAQQKRPVVDPQLAKLTKEQAFQKGEEQYAKKKQDPPRGLAARRPGEDLERRKEDSKKAGFEQQDVPLKR